MNKNVLYISYDGMTDPLGQSQVLPYLCGLSKEGYRFWILSFEKPDKYIREKDTITKICSDNNITWVPLPYHSSPPILSKIYDRWLMKKTAVALFKKHKFAAIHCRSYPSAEVGLFLKQNFGTKFLFDMRGFWPDEKVDSGHWDQQKPWYRKIYRHYKKMEKAFLDDADHIISLTQAGRKELIRVYGKAYREKRGLPLDIKFSVIPCCADLEHFNFHNIHEADKIALRASLGIGKEQKVLSYLGSLGTWYMIDEMLHFFKIYREIYPDSKFLFLTKEPEQIVLAALERNGIDKALVVTTFSNRAALPLHLSISDHSVFFIRPTYSKISSSPTKHAELMGLGVPVVCNDFGDTGTIIEQTNSGVVVADFSEDAYRKSVAVLNSDSLIPAEEIRTAAFQYFDLSTGVAAYARAYHQLFSSK